MKPFAERNQALVGLVSIVVAIAAVATALNFSHLPLVASTATYQADFANAGDLLKGDIVTIAGVRVGQIQSVGLHGDRVRVRFTLRAGLHVGTETSAAAKVLTPIGQEYVELTPAGPTRLTSADVIPESRTSIPSTLVGDLNTFAGQAQQYDTARLARSLQAAGRVFQGTPASDAAAALSGLARFSQVLAGRSQDLATLVTEGSKLTGVLSTRSGELVGLVGQGDLVLKVLDQRQQVIHQLLASTAALSTQLSSIVSGNRSQLDTLLSNLVTVSGLLARDSSTLGDAIPVLQAFDQYAANVTGSGPFADVTIPTMLLPDNVIKQCAGASIANGILGCQR